MGAFYGSVLVKTSDRDAAQKAVELAAKETSAKFLFGPVHNGWLSVFPDHAGQSDNVSAAIARHLPCDILHLQLHDDDVFAYSFYRNGQLADQYNSCPEYFGEVTENEKQACQGRPELLKDLLPNAASLGRLKALLGRGKKYAFEQERMEQFVKLLGLPNAMSSYEYLQRGERDGIKGWKQFVHIPDQQAEKAAQRAAQAQIKADKKRLQKEGVLLAEVQPPAAKARALFNSIAWGTDSASHGLLLTGESFHAGGPDDAGQRDSTEFFTLQPPWTTPPQPVGLKTGSMADVFCTSPSGRWLAGGFVAGDWKMRVWDWQRKALSFEVTHTRAVQWVAFSHDEQWVYSCGGDEFIVTSLAERKPALTINGVKGSRNAAVHPSGKFAVLASQKGLGIVDLEARRLVKTLAVNRRMEKVNLFPKQAEAELIQSTVRTLLENSQLRSKLGVSPEAYAAIQQDPAAIGQLSAAAQNTIQSMVEKVRFLSLETTENVFDAGFNPGGDQIFLASEGIRVFDWAKLLAAHNDAPAPELSVDAPRDDENDPNSRPLAYCVRFDPDRNLVLSSCLAGVIQYLNLKTGQSGVLFKPLEDVSVWRFELTSDHQAICIHCSERPKGRRDKSPSKQINCVQVWNYPALCKNAGLE